MVHCASIKRKHIWLIWSSRLVCTRVSSGHHTCRSAFIRYVTAKNPAAKLVIKRKSGLSSPPPLPPPTSSPNINHPPRSLNRHIHPQGGSCALILLLGAFLLAFSRQVIIFLLITSGFKERIPSLIFKDCRKPDWTKLELIAKFQFHKRIQHGIRSYLCDLNTKMFTCKSMTRFIYPLKIGKEDVFRRCKS